MNATLATDWQLINGLVKVWAAWPRFGRNHSMVLLLISVDVVRLSLISLSRVIAQPSPESIQPQTQAEPSLWALSPPGESLLGLCVGPAVAAGTGRRIVCDWRDPLPFLIVPRRLN